MIIASVLSLICLIPIAFVKEKRTKPQKRELTSSFGTLPKGLKIFLAIAAAFALGNFSYMFFVLRARDFFSDKWANILPVLLYVFFNIFYAGFVIPLGVLADKIGKRKVIIFGYLLFALTCGGFIFVRSVAGLAGSFCILWDFGGGGGQQPEGDCFGFGGRADKVRGAWDISYGCRPDGPARRSGCRSAVEIYFSIRRLLFMAVHWLNLCGDVNRLWWLYRADEINN